MTPSEFIKIINALDADVIELSDGDFGHLWGLMQPPDRNRPTDKAAHPGYDTVRAGQGVIFIHRTARQPYLDLRGVHLRDGV